MQSSHNLDVSVSLDSIYKWGKEEAILCNVQFFFLNSKRFYNSQHKVMMYLNVYIYKKLNSGW